jgi:hypothetical protein
MKKIISLISVLLIFACSAGVNDPRFIFQSGTLQPDDILGTWGSVGKPYVGVSGGVMVVMTDTIVWRLSRQGEFIFDSLQFVKEFHSSSLNPNSVGIPQQSGKVIYESGQNTDELNYGILKFRMPNYDSLWVNYAGQWEYLARIHQ